MGDQLSEENSFVLRPGYGFARLPYVPQRRRGSVPFVQATFRGIGVRRARGSELERVAAELSRSEVYRAFGFPRAPARRQVLRSRLPDLNGTFEVVEFLSVFHEPEGTPYGFLVAYQSGSLTRPEQELDFAVSDPGGKPESRWIRRVRTAVLSYLFALCGVKKVYWLRRKPLSRTSGGRTHTYYRRFGHPVISPLESFQRSLLRWSAAGDDLRLPRLRLGSWPGMPSAVAAAVESGSEGAA